MSVYRTIGPLVFYISTAVDDGWDEDSDFDMDSDDSDIEDTLCNTMLITGPHGSGKTVAVYALAQELGFKVRLHYVTPCSLQGHLAAVKVLQFILWPRNLVFRY